jgi:hypothetical protein
MEIQIGFPPKVRVFTTCFLKHTLPKSLEWKVAFSKYVLYCFLFLTRLDAHLLRMQIYVYSADRTIDVAVYCYVTFPGISLNIYHAENISAAVVFITMWFIFCHVLNFVHIEQFLRKPLQFALSFMYSKGRLDSCMRYQPGSL